MTRKATGSNWLVRGLMLLSALLLFAAPTLSSAAAMSQGGCCDGMPCQMHHKKAPCPDACVMACQVVVLPEASIVGPVEIDTAGISPVISLLFQGRVLAPELPPPR